MKKELNKLIEFYKVLATDVFKMKGIIVVGHGSRSEEAKELFLKIVDSLRVKLEDSNVEGCFMEISKPYIPAKIDEMYKNGVRDFIILPYFLVPGIHIKEDIPEILEEAKDKYGDITVKVAEPIGYHDKLIEILKERLEGEVTCI